MSITILTASDVDAIIKDRSTLDQALASQRAILTAFSNRSSDSTSEPPAIQIPLRTTVTSDDVTALCMPSRVKTLERSQGAAEAEEGAGTGIGVKLVCVPHNSQAGLPATTTLFDSRTGQLKAVVNARNLTALRNACASALFIQSLPEVSANATSLVLFGSGAQAKYHAQVLTATVPTLRKITVIARRETERLQTLVKESQETLDGEGPGYEVRSVVDTPESDQVTAAVSDADIICTMTSSTVPLFHSAVKPSCALILIGSYKPHMREISQEVMAQAREGHRRVVVDSREACLREAGELIEAGMGEEDVVELGEVLNGSTIGGENGKGAYLFKSVGISIQDIAIADVMLRMAKQQGRGTVIPGYD